MSRVLGWGLVLSLLVACSGGRSERSDQRQDEKDGGPDAFTETIGSATDPDAGDSARPGVDAAGPRCGDGRLDQGEQCDEGMRNGRAEPGACRTDCTVPRCGDEMVDPGEGCDTGALLSDVVTDACRIGCKAATCGDNVVDRGEQCDTGPARSDSAPGACRLDCKFSACGDGVVDEGEACDTGAARSDTEPGACRLNCSTPRCGDGVLDSGEKCDTGPARSDFDPNACRLSCALPSCGDGVVDMNESCDTGAARSDGAPNACRTTCRAPRCGDGVMDTGEACDDGNQLDTDGCRNDCSAASCGDGQRDLGEECDDGNRINADGCQATCLLPVCGDGVVDQGETCDDNNAFDNDGCRSNCMLGCLGRPDCSDGAFCNGEEECVAGLCQPGTAPTLDDMIACTNDRCDEDANTVAHTGADNLCTPNAAACTAGLRTSYGATCMPTMGCQQIARMDACPDAPSTCTPGAGLDVVLTTFAPSCAGSDCGAPAATTRTCAAPAPSCDPATRIGIVSRATCNAAGESCGSEIAERNDCARLDVRSCANDATAYRVTTGACTALGGCTSTMAETPCAAPGPSCQAGKRTSFAPVCDPQSGCGTPRALPSETCPNLPSLCDGSTHVRYEPSCADGASCALEGTPVRTACEGRGPSCALGTVTTYAPSCNALSGCATPTVAGTMLCPAPAATCAPSTDGFLHSRYAAACADGSTCAPNGNVTTTNCRGAAPACDQGVVTRFAASCDPAAGCGQPVVSERVACAASAPTCTASPEGFIHLRYAPSCADASNCTAQGAATMSVCATPPAMCIDGVVTAMAATCDPAGGCGVLAAPAAACPTSANSCVAKDGGGFTLTRFRAACSSATSCTPGGARATEDCNTPPSSCAGGQITTSTATCDAQTGCGSTTAPAVPCPAAPSTCTPAPQGFVFARYAPACLDGTSCAPRGAASTENCVAAGAVCANGAVSVSTATCDATTGCGLVRTPPVACPAPASTCEPVAGGFRYTRYEPACLNGASCVTGGAPRTESCTAPASMCVNGAISTATATCDPAGGCGVTTAPAAACPVAAPTCSTDAQGRVVHTTFTASCADGSSCTPGGTPTPTVCEAPPPVCSNGALTTYAPTCSPEGGCAFVATTSPCGTSAAMCNFDPNGAFVDHVSAGGGCNLAGNACTTTPPAVQRCNDRADFCEAGTRHSFAPACVPGQGCSVAETTSACPASAPDCVAGNGGPVHRTFVPGCNVEIPNACYSAGTPIEQQCTAGSAVCTMVNGVVGVTPSVATCDPVAGCGIASGQPVACVANPSTASCNGTKRVVPVPSCANGVCGTTTTETECPMDLANSCDGSLAIIRTPICRGAGICDATVTEVECYVAPTTSCEGNVFTSSGRSCVDGACGAVSVRRDCSAETSTQAPFCNQQGVRVVWDMTCYYGGCYDTQRVAPCASNQVCEAGECVERDLCAENEVVCDPQTVCTPDNKQLQDQVGSCEPSTGKCVYKNSGSPYGCTYGCNNGQCIIG